MIRVFVFIFSQALSVAAAEVSALDSSADSPQARFEVFNKRKVQGVKGGLIEIDGKWYTPDFMEEYLGKGGVLAMAGRKQLQAAQHRKTARYFTVAYVLSGAGIGSALGYFRNWKNYPDFGGPLRGIGLHYYAYYSDSSQEEIRDQTMIGAGIGCVIALTSVFFFQRDSRHFLEQFSLEYNRALSKWLKLDIAPVPGGAVGDVKISF